MGFLDRFGKKADVQVRLDRPAYAAGETIEAVVSVNAKKTFEVGEGRAELVYENEYKYVTREWDSMNKQYRRETETAKDREVAARQRFLERGKIERGTANEYRVLLPVPPDAVPSANGEITDVRWRIEAALDVEHATDPDAEAAVTIVSPATRYAEWARRPPRVDDEGDCKLDLALETRHLRTGGTVRGKFTLTATKEVDAQEIRAELVRHEEVPRGEGNQEERVEDKRRLSGGDHVAPGAQREFPFELTVPLAGPPTLETKHSTVRWFIRCVVARRLHSDYNVSVDLNVYSGAGAPADTDAFGVDVNAASAEPEFVDPLEVFKQHPGGGT